MLDVQDRSKNQKQYLKVFFAEGHKEKKPTHLESFIGHVGNKLLRNQRNQFCDLRNDFNAVIDDSQKKVCAFDSTLKSCNKTRLKFAKKLLKKRTRVKNRSCAEISIFLGLVA